MPPLLVERVETPKFEKLGVTVSECDLWIATECPIMSTCDLVGTTTWVMKFSTLPDPAFLQILDQMEQLLREMPQLPGARPLKVTIVVPREAVDATKRALEARTGR